MPMPSGIASSGLRTDPSGVIFEAMAGSLQRVAIGFVIGALIGIPLGLAVGTLRPLERSLRPVSTLRSIAPIAWIPMAMLWLGVRGNAALFIVAYAAFFPFVVNASPGGAADRPPPRSTRRRALGAGRLLILRAVILPSALPMLFTGARISLAFAWGSIIAAELAIGIKVTAGGSGATSGSAS